ncbi:MAG TPA: DNA translocase FtsK [Acidimicrobiales bacterium]
MATNRASSTAKRAAHAKRPAKRPAKATAKRSAHAHIVGKSAATAATALEGHGSDAVGVALLALGVIVGLASWLHLAGSAGHAIDSGIDALVGSVRFVAPVALAAAGVALFAAASDPGDEGAANRQPARLVVGSALLLVSVCGLLELSGHGGAVGWLAAVPLRGVVGSWATGTLLVALGVVGAIVLTQTSVRTVARRVGAGARPLGNLVSRLFTLESPSDRDGSSGLTTTLYDQDADVDLRDANNARNGRRRKHERATPKLTVPTSDGAEAKDEGEQLAIELGPAAKASPWKLPPLTLLQRAGSRDIDVSAVEERGRVLESALAQHGVETRLVGMVIGPSVTRYELELAPGVKVARLTSLHKDIAYALASPDVRILAPIPGRQAIGVEVPNAERQIVPLGDILASPEARQAKHPLEVAVGRDINGKAMLMNLATMPHLLIAGATGAGKSSCLNSIMTSILMRSTPEQVRMILVDPKRVEMGQYDRLPHLLTQVVTNPKKAANALSWAVREMERRYDLLAEVGFRDITGYNAAFDRGELVPEPGVEREYPRLPFILIVIDELSDLMMVAARDVEDSICRIAQMARAVGIHLVIATQRPSVNVITGVIKANIPARLAFAVSSVTDSRVILDQAGAERLIGAGDMLLLGPASSAPHRIQGSWVSEEEVRKIVAQWRRQAPEVAYDAQVQGSEDSAAVGGGSTDGNPGDGDDEALLIQAMELIVRSQLGSTSMLQRKLRVGFARAGRLMDLLEQRGVVGPSTGSKARDVLMTPEELDEALSRNG